MQTSDEENAIHPVPPSCLLNLFKFFPVIPRMFLYGKMFCLGSHTHFVVMSLHSLNLEDFPIIPWLSWSWKFWGLQTICFIACPSAAVCLRFPHDWIQVINICQEYLRSHAVIFTSHPPWRNQFHFGALLIKLILISGLRWALLSFLTLKCHFFSLGNWYYLVCLERGVWSSWDYMKISFLVKLSIYSCIHNLSRQS